ncbi:MAG: acireductone synthase [Nanoarchaeota archaeon]
MKTILSDINGTTSPAAIAKDFMADFLANGEAYLSRAEPKALAIYESIKRETGLDSPKEVLTFIKAELEKRNFKPDYLSLAGFVNVDGYHNGRLRTEVYPDVPVAFRDWKKNGKGVYTYSNGCGALQEQLFKTSTQGDLTGLIDGYFDSVEIGDKNSPDSYKRISDSIQVAPSDIMFLSDLEKELEAADKAGCQVRQVIRPGNKPVESDLYKRITSFAQV